MCPTCKKDEIRCSICNELILPDQIYVCYDGPSQMFPMGHQHVKFLCGKNGMTVTMYDEIKKNDPDSRPARKHYLDRLD